jgi:hypothetical protein
MSRAGQTTVGNGAEVEHGSPRNDDVKLCTGLD